MTRYGRPIAPMRYQTPPIGARVPAITRDIFRKRGFSQSHILAHWPAIVGEALAEYCSPEKLAFPRTPNEGRGPLSSATLTVRVDGPIALEIRHLEPQIVERINGYYGYTAVARLKLVQGPCRPGRKAAAASSVRSRKPSGMRSFGASTPSASRRSNRRSNGSAKESWGQVPGCPILGPAQPKGLIERAGARGHNASTSCRDRSK